MSNQIMMNDDDDDEGVSSKRNEGEVEEEESPLEQDVIVQVREPIACFWFCPNDVFNVGTRSIGATWLGL
jgi:hypothetical protein